MKAVDVPEGGEAWTEAAEAPEQGVVDSAH
jgi:hypothetical protein